MSSVSTTELIKVRSILARALSIEDVNDLGRTTGRAGRLRTVTPHRLLLAVVSALVARLYRFRWQIALCFKEWTSCANLHAARTCLASTESAACGPGWPPQEV